MSGLEERWTAAVASWAHSRPDIRAWCRSAPRAARRAAGPDGRISSTRSSPREPGQNTRSGALGGKLGACWAHGSEDAFGGVPKLTGVFEGSIGGGLHRRAAPGDAGTLRCLPLRWPGGRSRPVGPGNLEGAGIESLRASRRRHRLGAVIKGARHWEGDPRLLAVSFAGVPLSEAELVRACGDFWIQARVGREEGRARGVCRGAAHLPPLPHRGLPSPPRADGPDSGTRAYPRGPPGGDNRMTPAQLAGRCRGSPSTGPRPRCTRALVKIADEFTSLSAAKLASKNGWRLPDYSEGEGSWLAGLRSVSLAAPSGANAGRPATRPGGRGKG